MLVKKLTFICQKPIETESAGVLKTEQPNIKIRKYDNVVHGSLQ